MKLLPISSIITYSGYRDHTNHLFIEHTCKIIKFHDLILHHNASFVYNFNTGNLPKILHRIGFRKENSQMEL